MAGAGYRDWSPGDIPTATQFDTFLQEQTVMVFASAAARNAALAAVVAEGMHAVLLDTNSLTVYSGSAWSTIGPVHGALTTWTPTVTQSGAVTVTNTRSTYSRVGRQIHGSFVLTVTGAGTANNEVRISLPVAAVGTALVEHIGTGSIQDTSNTSQFPGLLVLHDANTCKYVDTTAGTTTGIFLGETLSGFAVALASTDLVIGRFSYEAAADA